MQKFIAKWNDNEISFEIASSSNPLQLLLTIQDQFQLENCEIANLKKRKGISEDVAINENMTAISKQTLRFLIQDDAHHIIDFFLEANFFDQDWLNIGLSIAIQVGFCHIAQLFLNAGANINDIKSILEDAICTRSIEIVQLVIQEIQSKQDKWQESFTQSNKIEILELACIPRKCEDIVLYLFNIRFINQSLFPMIINNSSYIKEILEKREKIETIANIASTTIAYEIFTFPVDVNRILLEYYIGTDGRHAIQYKLDLDKFIKFSISHKD